MEFWVKLVRVARMSRAKRRSSMLGIKRTCSRSMGFGHVCTHIRRNAWGWWANIWSHTGLRMYENLCRRFSVQICGVDQPKKWLSSVTLVAIDSPGCWKSKLLTPTPSHFPRRRSCWKRNNLKKQQNCHWQRCCTWLINVGRFEFPTGNWPLSTASHFYTMINHD